MRRLVLLALVTLAAFPLSAHGPWRGPRRVLVVEDSCRPYRSWEGNRRWDDDRWERRNRYRYEDRRDDCDEGRVIFRPRPLPRPLAPPFQGRVELWIR
ncbi:hypothetical protein GETHOR_28990 [Geothrix oryzae]|uniref:Secreted protein n=1 Tax=Geothrix oryzae TaxID=2927975 RepID=A0ABN6V3B3_9BACT|nr:hypothetical protein [Geothrix oryzae]BDU70798.1 hypothetical protein GETHOR_28990 [Geothrix oryzae]